jgi:hypothetical protein
MNTVVCYNYGGFYTEPTLARRRTPTGVSRGLPL